MSCASTWQTNQLIDYEQIMIVLTEHTQAGKLVSTMAIDPEDSSEDYITYALKDTYKEQIETYKGCRRQMYGDYAF